MFYIVEPLILFGNSTQGANSVFRYKKREGYFCCLMCSAYIYCARQLITGEQEDLSKINGKINGQFYVFSFQIAANLR